ncbi:DJ-1/PfpI family protein, partial [Longibacter sp.]|uniref:DJ-1/PfpI family protein n=1 Tax=Longibacter sp. TaxID=2045415 RepID=UPI003EBC8B01
AADDPEIVDFVRQRAHGGTTMLSVCTGIRILHAAGLLSGRPVTTHHAAFDEVDGWDAVELLHGRRVVRDGDVWTSAGVTAGMDLALAAIETWSSRDEADRVRAYVEYASGDERPADP